MYSQAERGCAAQLMYPPPIGILGEFASSFYLPNRPTKQNMTAPRADSDVSGAS